MEVLPDFLRRFAALVGAVHVIYGVSAQHDRELIGVNRSGKEE